MSTKTTTEKIAIMQAHEGGAEIEIFNKQSREDGWDIVYDHCVPYIGQAFKDLK